MNRVQIPTPDPALADSGSEEALSRPPPLLVGELKVSPPIILAPMSGLTNLPMRTLCEEAGCGLTITEFIAAPALAAGVPKELSKLQPSRHGRAFGVQIFGRDPGQMARSAELAVSRGAALVDINMGCPSRKVTNGVAGSALMRVPELAQSLVEAVLRAVDGQALVTVKIRAGWNEEQQNAPEFAARMVDSGAALVTVHGRTARQGFSGRADLQIIRQVKEAVDVPVVGNGDVTDAASLQRMFQVTGCDGAMIGRAALGNPWIFSTCRAWWREEAVPAPPTIGDRLAMYLRHLDLYLEIAKPRRAIVEMRKFAGWYLKGFAGAARLRRAIYHSEDLDRIRELVREAAGKMANAAS